jgi:putative MFS transporter
MSRKIFFSVLVAALGYFVDVYDLVLFSVVRVPSLTHGLGLKGADVTRYGVLLLNVQMGAMIFGGFLWGVLGDRKGRLAILMGSILMFSAANIANAFVTNIPAYALCRFFAGLGLAGEIGAGATLVSEILPRAQRNTGTTVFAAIGVAGGFVASLLGDYFTWKTAYLVGGGLGLALLALRVATAESGLFGALEKKAHVRRGDLSMLLLDPARLKRYACCVLMGVPVWFILGLILTFSPEIGRELHLHGDVRTGNAMLHYFGGIVFGNAASGFLSGKLKSRKKVLLLFIAATCGLTFGLMNLPLHAVSESYYIVCAALGVANGYWTLFLAVTTENFGTNLRATATTSAPNMVRSGALALSLIFAAMKETLGVVHSLQLLALVTFSAAFAALYFLRETFGRDLDFIEE